MGWPDAMCVVSFMAAFAAVVWAKAWHAVRMSKLAIDAAKDGVQTRPIE